ncbi:UNVERIFIED_CONTAM: hypothetical protein FKN15_025263 [Acipenser sinensis]
MLSLGNQQETGSGDTECLQTLPRFCFPFDVERVRESPVVQHFTFVLTDLEGQQRFGFCRLTSRTCLCILRSVNQTPLLQVEYQCQCFSVFRLQCSPVMVISRLQRNVTELVVSVDVTNMLHLYASLLFERRILLASSKLSTRVKSRALEDVVILNIDTNTLESPFEDLEKLPAEVDDQIIFMEETFINHKSNPMKQFLQSAVHLQLFKQFIDNRLEKLNSGNGFGDVFEEEITHCGLSAGASKSHQQWVDNLKSRPRRPTRRYTSPLGESDAMDKHRAWALRWDEDYGSPDNGVQGAADDPGEPEDFNFLSGSSEMDLLGEIFDTLSTQTCQERGLLYGTRSLDLFSSDSSDYIRRVRSITPSNESLTSPPWRAGSDLGWELEEEDECSLEYGASSTDNIASEDLTAETTAAQPGAGTLTVTCIAGSSGEPDGNFLKRNSGRWDRGIAENEGKDGGEEGNSDPVAQTPTRIHWETEGAERGQIGSEDNQGSTGSAGKGDHGSTGSTVVQVQGSTGCTTSQKSTGSEDTEQGSTGSPKSITEDKEGVDIQVKTQGEATGNMDRAGYEVHCSSEDSASSSSCSANQQGDSAEELKQTPPREDSGTDQLQSPRVLSAVALFQAKGKSPEPRPGPARFGCIRRGADAGPGRKSPALDPAWNGRLETQAASLEALDPEREPAVQSSPSPAPDPLPVKKVSELKKRFEA